MKNSVEMQAVFGLAGLALLVVVGVSGCSEKESTFTGSTGKAAVFDPDCEEGTADCDATSTTNSDPDPNQTATPEGTTPSTSTTTSTDTDPDLSSCTESNGDKVNIKFSNTAINTCMDGGKIWDFINNECSNVPAASFDCGWETINTEVRNLLGSENPVIYKSRDKGAMLIACGQKNSNQIIMVQWIYPGKIENIDCNRTVTQPSVLTGCYRGDKQVDTSNPKQVVKDCFAE